MGIKVGLEVDTRESAYNYTVNTVITTLYSVANLCGVDTDVLAADRRAIEYGLYIWLWSRHLESVALDIRDENDDPLERYVVSLEYPSEEWDRTDRDERQQGETVPPEGLTDELSSMEPLSGVDSMRVIASLFEANDHGQEPPNVESWEQTELTATRLLTRDRFAAYSTNR